MVLENNASYRGFIYQSKVKDNYNVFYFDTYIKDAGNLGRDFAAYYEGNPKLGDTPALLYVMDGNLDDPTGESWGGSFEPIRHSSRFILDCPTTVEDSVQVFSVLEFHIKGPIRNDIPADSACVTLTIRNQKWKGYHLGNGDYVVRHSTYYTGTVPYISSDISGFPNQEGEITVVNLWTDRNGDTDYPLGNSWFSDKSAQSCFWKGYQGAQTVFQWRNAIMEDWGKRWQWLKEE